METVLDHTVQLYGEKPAGKYREVAQRESTGSFSLGRRFASFSLVLLSKPGHKDQFIPGREAKVSVAAMILFHT
jgi:hypothetical protein